MCGHKYAMIDIISIYSHIDLILNPAIVRAARARNAQSRLLQRENKNIKGLMSKINKCFVLGKVNRDM